MTDNQMMEKIKELKELEGRLKAINDIRDLQGDNGNWNHDPYMHGMYNALEFASSIMEGREPVFRDAPEQWLQDLPKSNEPPKASEVHEDTIS